MTRATRVTRRTVLGGLSAGGLGAAALGPTAALSAGESRRPRIGGKIVARGDARYEEWRRGMPWQMVKPARFPELIVQPRSAEEVATTLRFAKRNGLRVAVKSGGHHVWANFLRNDGLLLDLSQLRGVQIDAEQRRAQAGPAVWARNLIQRTLPHGLGFPVAHCATVPLGGFLLGGGFGLNGDEWGTMSCFAVRSAEVVTAAGDIIAVSPTQNQDLFWALQGAGNGFPGVVTRFDLQLFPAPNEVLSSTYIFPAARIADVAALAQEFAHQAPPHTEILGIAAIGGRDTSGGNQVICALRVAVFSPDSEQARSILAPLARHPLTSSAVMKFESTPSDWESLFLDSIDATQGFGFGRYAVDNIWTDSAAQIMPILADRLAVSPSRYAHAVVQFKVRTQIPADAALSRIAPTYAGVYSVWRDESADDQARTWLRETMLPLQRYARGHYINEIDAEARPASIEGSFSDSAWKRLAQLRRRVDPNSVFHDFFARGATSPEG